MNLPSENLLRALHEFEQAWERGEPRDVREFAELHSQLAPELLPELVVLDCDCRWQFQRDDFLPVQVYRGRFPEIAGMPGVLLELVCLEVLNWPRAKEAHYVETFPELEEEIRELFELLPQLPEDERPGMLDAIRKTLRAESDRTLGRDGAHADAITELRKLSRGDAVQFVDDCRIISEVGEGSHKWVFQAWQSSTGQPLAVKQLKRKSADLLGAFVSEGRAQANLDHQNIPPTMLLGPDQDEPTIVAEKLIRGTPWSQVLDAGELSLERHLNVLLTVSRAAEYAHRERGIVHRDIKPENVLIGRYHEVYLVDWGLAVRFGHDENHLQDDKIRHVEQEPDGVGAGTPAYMSPELALGRWDRCTPATDVFQLGAILYHLLSGRPPFLGLPRTAFLRAALRRYPELAADAPAELKAIVAKAMAHEPQDRYQDAGEFADAIELYFDHRTAEELYDRASKTLGGLRESLNESGSTRPEAHTVVTALIALADQFRQAGQSWRDSASRGAGQANVRARDAAESTDSFTSTGVSLARDAECETRRELVRQAIDSGDLVLAEAQAMELDGLHDTAAPELVKQVYVAKAKRHRKNLQRIGFAASAFVLFIVAAGFWVMRSRADLQAARADQERTSAEATRDIALADLARSRTEAVLEKTNFERSNEQRRFAQSQLDIIRAVRAESRAFASGNASYRSRAVTILPKNSNHGERIHLSDASQASLVARTTTSRRLMTGNVVFASDGNLFVSMDLQDSAIRVWSTKDWAQSFVLLGHQVPEERGGLWGTIRAAAFNPANTNELITTGLDGTVRAWNLDQRKEVRSFGSATSNPQLAVMALAIDRTSDTNGTGRVVIGRRDGKLLWLDLSTLQKTAEIDGHAAHVTSIGYRPDGSQVASTGGDGLVKLWNPNGTPVAALPHPDQQDGEEPIEMHDLAYSPDGSQLAAGGADGKIHLWDPDTHTLIRSLPGHPPAPHGKKTIRTLAWQENGRLLSGASDGTIRQWDTETGELLKVLEGHGENMYGNRVIWDLAVNPSDTNQIASCGGDDTIRIWDAESEKATFGLEGMRVIPEGFLTPIPTRSAYIPGDDTLITAGMSTDAFLRSWNAESLRERRTFTGLPELPDMNMMDRVNAVAARPDGKQFVSAEPTGELIYWDAETGEILRTIKAHEPKQIAEIPGVGLLPPMGMTSVAWSPNGKMVASLGHDALMKIWNAASGELVAEWNSVDPEHRPELPPGAELLPDNLKQMLLSTQVQPADHLALFSVDNRKLVTAGRDRIVRIWDIESKTLERRLTHIEQVTATALSWDGEHLASGSANGRITVWRFEEGLTVQQLTLKPLMLPEQFGGPLPLKPAMQQQGELERAKWAPRVHSLTFSPGGRHLAATLGDGSLSLIQVASGTVTHRSVGHESPPAGMLMVDCLFTKTGQLLTVGDDNTVRQWDLPAWDRGRTELAESAVVRGGRELAAGPDGELAIAGNDFRLVRWADSQDKSPTAWRPEKDALYSVAYIPDSNDLLMGTTFGRAIRFNRTANEPVLTFAGPDGNRVFPISMVKTIVAASPDGSIAASSWAGGDIELWALADGSAVRTLKGTGKEVMAITFRPDGKQLAVTDFDGTLRLWDVSDTDDNTLQFELLGPRQASGLDYSPDGNRLVQAGQVQDSQTIVIWDPRSGRQVASLSGHVPVEIIPGATTLQVFDADFSGDGKWLATCAADATVRIWKTSFDGADPTQDVYEPFAVLSTKRLGSLINTEQEDSVSDPTGLFGAADTGDVQTWLKTVTFNADSRQVATAGLDGPVQVFDMQAIIDEATLTPDQLRERTERLTGLRLEQDYIVPIQQIQLVPLEE